MIHVSKRSKSQRHFPGASDLSVVESVCLSIILLLAPVPPPPPRPTITHHHHYLLLLLFSSPCASPLLVHPKAMSYSDYGIEEIILLPSHNTQFLICQQYILTCLCVCICAYIVPNRGMNSKEYHYEHHCRERPKMPVHTV